MSEVVGPEELRKRLLQLDRELRRKGTLSWKEECRLCHREFLLRFLQRCSKCGRLYCANCLTKGLTEDKGQICLRCARKLVSPRKMASKYTPISNYLAYRARYTAVVKLTFARIEGVIADNLPLSAYRNRNWWNNSRGKAWVNVGWEVIDANLDNGTVTFRRPKGLLEKKSRKRKKATTFKLPTKPKIPRKPSKTKISRAQARLKNIERRRSSNRRYRGKFKPKPAFEKKLYQPETKPSMND